MITINGVDSYLYPALVGLTDRPSSDSERFSPAVFMYRAPDPFDYILPNRKRLPFLSMVMGTQSPSMIIPIDIEKRRCRVLRVPNSSGIIRPEVMSNVPRPGFRERKPRNQTHILVKRIIYKTRWLLKYAPIEHIELPPWKQPPLPFILFFRESRVILTIPLYDRYILVSLLPPVIDLKLEPPELIRRSR